MRIKFWGVRGSIPTPSTPDFSTSRYGGNTTCVSIRAPGALIVLDGGSGLRALGMKLASEKSLRATFFFSHLHWDHIQGFPFFLPGFCKGNRFELYGPRLSPFAFGSISLLEESLRTQQASFHFPVHVSEMQSELNFKDLSDGQQVEIQADQSRFVITAGALNHPGGCFGYRVDEHQSGGGVKSFVMATDHEHFENGQLNPSLQKLARDADVLLYDAQYTPDEYEGRNCTARQGWGHSTYLQGIQEARAAGVKKLLLTHHDPLHDDWAVARIENDARREGIKFGLPVAAAFEGMALNL